ncbi:class I SAM-dependent methyltransferase [Gryllotalpicola reticulitermitis]|uniref:Class I SAM-dependent methyltransferase n=1 Tax=Gryllotalpicola reticulitermitis TaxID=1184153 RepID=A0ABV8QAL1_9MICO
MANKPRGVPPDAVTAYSGRATDYDVGVRGRLHRGIANRVVTTAVRVAPAPRRVLDVGSGTGFLLRRLAQRLPQTAELVGVEPAPGMIRVAEAAAAETRIRFLSGVAEQLPFPDAYFDLVTTVTSFDHWPDQLQGLRECARVLRPGGQFVLCDRISSVFALTAPGRRQRKARTPRRVEYLLGQAGLTGPTWQPSYALIIGTVSATKL